MTRVLLLVLVGCTGDVGGGEPSGPAPHVDIEGPTVLPHVQLFADELCRDVGSCHFSTYEGHDPVAARALDIRVSDQFGELPKDGNALGNATADYALADTTHGVMYVIWMQRYNDGSGWSMMEDRGSITQNHYDHVHVSFEETAP